MSSSTPAECSPEIQELFPPETTGTNCDLWAEPHTLYPAGGAPFVGDVKSEGPAQAVGPRTGRTRLTAKEKLELAQLCVLHGGEYTQKGGRERFWIKMQGLFSDGIGRSCGNPRPIMSHMLAEFEAKIEREGRETGTAQTDGEYEQTMAKWKTRVDSSGDGRANQGGLGTKGMSEIAHDQAVAELHRSNMLSTLSTKRTFQEAMSALTAHQREKNAAPIMGPEGDEGDILPVATGSYMPGAFAGGEQTTKAAQRQQKMESVRDKRRKIRERGDYLDARQEEEGNRLTNALERVISALLPAPGSGPGPFEDSSGLSPHVTSSVSEVTGSQVAATEERLGALEEKMEEIELAVEKIQKSTDEILKILLSRQ